MEKQDLEFLRIARAIPVGSRNIERMRQEIHNTVTTVLGLLGNTSITAKQGSIETFAGHVWRVGTGFGTLPVILVVEYGYFQPGVPNVVLYNSIRASRGESTIPMEHVMRIYEYLGHFIKLMYEVFPELPEKLRPLIEAGGVNKELFQ